MTTHNRAVQNWRVQNRAVLAAPQGQLMMSCQANPDSSLRDSFIIRRLALRAVKGGAATLQIQGFVDVPGVTDLPFAALTNLTNTARVNPKVFLIPDAAEALKLARLGALVMVAIRTLVEAHNAYALGADLVGTTLNGYTPQIRALHRPDWELTDEIRADGLAVIAECCLNSPARAAQAVRRAAFVVGMGVVGMGSAITRPDAVTDWLTKAVTGA